MKKSFFKYFLTYLFIGTIFCSCFIILFGDFGYNLHLLKLERGNPKKESFPKIKRIKNAPKKIDAYFDYHFPLKKFFLSFGNTIFYYLLNVSTTNKVVIGKDNWLFNGGKNIDYAKGKLFTKKQLKSLTHFFLKRKKFFNDNNIEYILFFAPDKEAIYPEFYSRKYEPIPKYNRYDQLVDYLRENTSIDVIYAKQKVKESCKNSQYPCYFKFDSHWNDIGAFYAYQTIYDFLLKKYPKLIAANFNDYNLTYEVGNKGFINMLGIYDFNNLDIRSPFLVSKFSELNEIQSSIDVEAKEIVNIVEYKNLDPNAKDLIPKIFIFGDSFSFRLSKYFVFNAKEVINVRNANKIFKLKSILNYHPTILIDEFLTRKISENIKKY